MTIIKREKFDEDVMKPLLNDERYNKNDRQRLSKYNKLRMSGGSVNVNYKFGAGCEENQLGRLFPEDGCGLQAFRFDLRNPLAEKYYWDTDYENCHYVIANHFCINYKIKHECIEYYIKNRDACLSLVSSFRKKSKTEFLKVLYGGDIKLYNDIYNDVEGEILPTGYDLLKTLQSEVETLMLLIWEKYPQYHKLKMGKEKKMIIKKTNPKASLMSLIFQTEERKMLLEWDAYLTEQNRYLGVFIHDGGYVEKLEKETVFPEELLLDGSETSSWV